MKYMSLANFHVPLLSGNLDWLHSEIAEPGRNAEECELERQLRTSTDSRLGQHHSPQMAFSKHPET